MATVETELVNRALDLIGKERIVDIADQDDPVAVRCRNAYQAQLDAVLRDHWWNCAKDLRRLAAAATTPAHTWSYQYPLPPDCLKVRLVNEATEWERHGRMILTDAIAPIDVEIIKRLTNAAEIDSDLADALEYRLAGRFASMFNHDDGKAGGFFEVYEIRVSQAKMNDGQEGRVRTWQGSRRYTTAVRGY